MEAPFTDRSAGGRALARKLSAYADQPDVLVLALPRGGVPVAYEVARALNAELDVMVVRKIGVPYHPELAMGAIASGGGLVLNDDVIAGTGVAQHLIDEVVAREKTELARREAAYRKGRPPLSVSGRTVILVDDGLATGASMEAAVRALRKLGPERVVVAVPVAPQDAASRFAALADDFVCVSTPAHFMAVGQWYHRFDQTTDEEVSRLLADSAVR